MISLILSSGVVLVAFALVQDAIERDRRLKDTKRALTYWRVTKPVKR